MKMDKSKLHITHDKSQRHWYMYYDSFLHKSKIRTTVYLWNEYLGIKAYITHRVEKESF